MTSRKKNAEQATVQDKNYAEEMKVASELAQTKYDELALQHDTEMKVALVEAESKYAQLWS